MGFVNRVNWDRVTIIFWFILGLILVEESFRLNLGKLHQPDSGFFPFLASSLLVVLSLILLIQSSSNKSEQKKAKENIRYGNIIGCLTSLYVYSWLLEWLGFIPSTFFFIIFLIKFIGKKRWLVAIFAASLTAITSYIFFGVWLQAPLPKGFLWD